MAAGSSSALPRQAMAAVEYAGAALDWRDGLRLQIHRTPNPAKLSTLLETRGFPTWQRRRPGGSGSGNGRGPGGRLGHLGRPGGDRLGPGPESRIDHRPRSRTSESWRVGFCSGATRGPTSSTASGRAFRATLRPRSARKTLGGCRWSRPLALTPACRPRWTTPCEPSWRCSPWTRSGVRIRPESRRGRSRGSG